MYSNSCDCSLQVHVDKGMNDGQKITFRGEGDQEVRQTMWQTVREFVDLQLLYNNLLQGLKLDFGGTHHLCTICIHKLKDFKFPGK